jgi:hypothetical protein
LKPDTPRHAVRFIPQRSLCLTEEQSGDDDAGQMATLIGYKKQSWLFHFTCISQEIEARSAAGQPQLTKHGRRFILICLALPPDATYDVLTIYWFPRVLVADENNAHWAWQSAPCMHFVPLGDACVCMLGRIIAISCFLFNESPVLHEITARAAEQIAHSTHAHSADAFIRLGF